MEEATGVAFVKYVSVFTRIKQRYFKSWCQTVIKHEAFFERSMLRLLYFFGKNVKYMINRFKKAVG